MNKSSDVDDNARASGNLEISKLGMNTTHDRIDVLDGWRALSVMLVIQWHVLLFSSIRLADSSSFAWRKIYFPFLFSLGALGVNIFFVISGFVIARGFLKEADKTGGVSLRAFYVRRFFRLIPPLALYLAVVAALALLGLFKTQEIANLARVLTFTCNFPAADCGGWLGAHTWSLSVEEQFYLVIPLIFVVLANHRRIGITGLALVFAACVTALGASRFYATGAFFVPHVLIGGGVIFALNEQRVRHVVGKLPGWSVYPMLALLPLIARASITRFWLVTNFALPAIIVALLTTTMLKPSRFRDVLMLPAMRKIGVCSYSIYLWQQLALKPFSGAGVLFYALSLTAVIAWSFASFRYFENPLIAIGARFSARIKAGSRPS